MAPVALVLPMSKDQGLRGVNKDWGHSRTAPSLSLDSLNVILVHYFSG